MNKLSVRKASEKYGLPTTTLYEYIKNKNNIFRKPGGQVVLSKKDEDTLVEGLITFSERGFPLRASDLQILVKSYTKRINRTVRINTKICLA